MELEKVKDDLSKMEGELMKKIIIGREKGLGIFIYLFIIVVAITACSNTTKQEETSKVSQETSAGTLKVEGTPTNDKMNEISTDGSDFIDKLISFGFKKKEAIKNAKILMKCGIPTIDICEPTDDKATIDGLISYRGKLDNDRVFWFTVDHRKIFYVSLNGEDLYDEDKGGYLKNFKDVHIPETYVSYETKIKLRDLTEEILDSYFKYDVRYYDAWGIGRKDNKYGVKCEISDGSILTDKWYYGYVWYELQKNGEFKATGVKIDDVFYEIKK